MKPIKNFKVVKISVLGICVHILLLLAVFDIYFKSPLENGMTPVKSTDDPPSKRVILFVADGLRAQAIFDKNENVTPFLSSIRKTRGAWGVSHARLPTESRTNHVSILGGICEDPTAVFNKFREFPVDYDSVLNESKNAWIIGTRQVIKLFQLKDQIKHLKTTILPIGAHKNEDAWVFDEMTSLLNNSRHSRLFEDSGNIFSLHLSGIDKLAHSKKPYSKEFLEHIRNVDDNIRKMDILIKNTFSDNLTTFIFTADHGMNDFGTHGSGSDYETYTPFITWGAGIKANESRQDIYQTDISPLISSLIGINYPMNSLGKLPIQYLNLSAENKLHLYLTNIQQLFRILEIKQKRIKDKSLFYKPYLTDQEFNRNISRLFNSSEMEYEQLFKRCEKLADFILEGINYFNCYYMFTLLLIHIVAIFHVLHLH
ncbi:hypothetical protein HHI36_017040 [Cryptolaemus montrouzieri]|uniref:GPI ethanolamine phosphate transferase 1 n=1 Tax=Cryptolaemus montrouzieri TaxID=559131 RepID=A0ABD2NLE3_9CUCU